MWSRRPIASLLIVSLALLAIDGDGPTNAQEYATFPVSTDTTPCVSETSPETDSIRVPFESNLSVTFSEPVDVTGSWFQIDCTSSGTRDVSDTFVSGGPTVFDIDPNDDFSADEECTVTIFAANVTNQDTDDPPYTMSANTSFSFRTEAPPGVSDTYPVTIAPPATDVVVRFDEPVTATASSFTIVCAGSTVPYTLSTEDKMTYTLDPASDLTDGATCAVTVIAAQVTDDDAIDPPETMAPDVVFSFGVDASAFRVRNDPGGPLRVLAAFYADQGHERGHHAASDRSR